jgi:beta-glucanase (GH16 family)
VKRSAALPHLGIVLALALASCGEATEQTTTAPVGSDATTTTVESTIASIESYHPENSGWELIWSDEFEGTGLDETKWGFEQNCWGGGNQEQQCYTDRPDNTFVSEGVLHIRALEEEFTGLDGHEDWDNTDQLGTTTLPYTSGRIRTKGKGDWRYGRFEIRAQLPFGQGLWPAMWMLPTDSVYGGWAASGEIDIMEAINLKTVWAPDNNSVHGTLHFGAEWPSNVSSGTYLQLFDAHPADSFHVYALEWEEGEFRWYVDDVHYATQTSDGWYSEVSNPDGSVTTLEGTAPFDEEFHLLLNVAVGGTWPGPPDDSTTFPQEMLVDYVRVYRCSVSPADGRGCATISDTAIQVEGRQPPESLFEGVFTGEFDPAALSDEMIIFEDDQIFPWKWDSWIGSGSLDMELIEDAERGTVIQTTFGTNEAVVYFQAPVTYDLSDWVDGFVEFDMKVLDTGRAGGLLMRVDCVHPCSSGDYPIGMPELGEWTHYAVSLSDLLSKSGSTLDMTSINTPLVIFPSWGNQQGAVIQVDNVRWTR